MVHYARCVHRGVLEIVRRISGGSLAKRTALARASGLEKSIVGDVDEVIDPEVLNHRKVRRNFSKDVALSMVQLDVFQHLPPAHLSVRVVELIKAEAALGVSRWSVRPEMCEAVCKPLPETCESHEAQKEVEGTL